MVLFTFPISHFAEKARWALDLNAIAYVERRLLPGPHYPIIRWRAPRSSVPVLEHGRTVVQGSSAILDYLQEGLGAMRLAPSPSAAKRCAELEELADRAYGLGALRVFYGTMLDEPNALLDMWMQGSPRWSPLYRLGFGIARRATLSKYGIDAVAVAEARDLVLRAADVTDRALAKSRYLLGDTLSRADVTVASLLALLCQPPEHLVRWPVAPDSGSALTALRTELEARPTWAFVRRMYREHRRCSAVQER